MSELEPFQLPRQYGGKFIITNRELGRLTIAGCLDLATLCSNGEWRWPTPLLLLDGMEAGKRRSLQESSRRLYYGPTVREGVWQLAGGELALMVDFPNDKTIEPSANLGYGLSPDDHVTAYMFVDPIAYDQEDFDDLASRFEGSFADNAVVL
jgi:hypothetical protein